MIVSKQINKKLKKTQCFFSTLNTPIIYSDVLKEKSTILKENRNKCGIYKWTNRANGKVYIGSSVNISNRISNYLSFNFLTKKVKISSSKIYKALLTDSHSIFNLEILEYCDRSIVINREQYYIDKFKPEYNILTKAGSSLGYKHSKETLAKFKLRKFSP